MRYTAKRRPWKLCPHCGAHLDHGERCDCDCSSAEPEDERTTGAVVPTEDDCGCVPPWTLEEFKAMFLGG